MIFYFNLRRSNGKSSLINIEVPLLCVELARCAINANTYIIIVRQSIAMNSRYNVDVVKIHACTSFP